MTHKTRLDHDLTALVAKHGEWLDGRTWQQACDRITRGFFEADDLDPRPREMDLDAALAATRRELAD